MQAEIMIRCSQCLELLGEAPIDTADMPDELQRKINKIILAHRQYCEYDPSK